MPATTPTIEEAGYHPTMNDLYTTAPTQIVLYTTEYCSDCLRAKKFFEANNIPHLKVGLEGNREATEFVMKVNHGYRSVPTIVFPDGSILVEPNWEELRAKFSAS
jgi:mycoredoxin